LNLERLFIRVILGFIKFSDFELLEKFPDINNLIRIVCRIRFKTRDGFTEARHAIIDTGAFISILPLSLWKRLDVELIGKHYVRGLVPKKECFMNIEIGWIKAMMVDEEGNQTNELEIRAFLAPNDKVPVIIGFKDLLEKFYMYIDPINEIGYIE